MKRKIYYTNKEEAINVLNQLNENWVFDGENLYIKD